MKNDENGKAYRASRYAEKRDEMLAYGRGYSAGLRGSWPEHKPPYPPEPVLRAMYEAARRLRDAADNACAQMAPDDILVQELDPGIQAIDDASVLFTEWLKSVDQAPPDSSPSGG